MQMCLINTHQHLNELMHAPSSAPHSYLHAPCTSHSATKTPPGHLVFGFQCFTGAYCHCAAKSCLSLPCSSFAEPLIREKRRRDGRGLVGAAGVSRGAASPGECRRPPLRDEHFSLSGVDVFSAMLRIFRVVFTSPAASTLKVKSAYRRKSSSGAARQAAFR